MTGGAAAAAAAARKRRERQEEEERTSYTSEEWAEGWEFKIVRSSTGAFRTPAFLRAVLDEEQRAGWTLVEKFDNGRIRLKRPASARASDPTLGCDAYRTHVGLSEWKLALCILGGVLGALALIGSIVALVANAG